MEGHQLDVLHQRVLVRLLHADGDSVDGPVHVVPLDDLLRRPRRVDGGFVQEVLQRRAGQSGRAPRHLLQVDVWTQRLVARMHLKKRGSRS